MEPVQYSEQQHSSGRRAAGPIKQFSEEDIMDRIFLMLLLTVLCLALLHYHNRNNRRTIESLRMGLFSEVYSILCSKNMFKIPKI
ncbi:hypothetical protein QZH41_006260 [Actinostola sp. cb2023]|nr:hypothetical protein QZH41_006260 [Actinostola sp. cb2023]